MGHKRVLVFLAVLAALVMVVLEPTLTGSPLKVPLATFLAVILLLISVPDVPQKPQEEEEGSQHPVDASTYSPPASFPSEDTLPPSYDDVRLQDIQAMEGGEELGRKEILLSVDELPTYEEATQAST